MTKSTSGRAFENHCKGVVGEVLSRRSTFRMPENRGWDMVVLFWIPKLETVQWLDRGEGARFTRKDVDGPLKIIMDGVYRALDTDDSANIRVTIEKRDGRGDCWVDFMLKEVHVPTEPRNATEVACEINARGGPIRASPTDEPAMLEHLRSRIPDMGEYRLTAFDAWRIEIMLQTNLVFEQMQGRVICPARTGRLDACFDCSDMKVINCIMNNPRVITDEGKVAGWFDLCSQKTGTHVALRDGPKGGDSMTEKTKTLDIWFNEYLLNMNAVISDPGRATSAVIAAGNLILQAKETEGADEQKKAYAICARLAVALFHQHKAGPWKPLPQQTPSYRTTTREQFPQEVLDLVKEMKNKLNAKEKGRGDWMAPAMAAQYYYNLVMAPVDEAQKKGIQPWKQKPAEAEAKVEEPKARKKRTPAKEETPPDEVPAVLGDASIDIQDEGMPRVKEIPAGEQLELAATEEREEIEAEETPADGDSDADLAALLGDEEAPKPTTKPPAKAPPKAAAKPSAPTAPAKTPAKEKLMEVIIGKDPVLNELKTLRAELAAFKQEQGEKQEKYKANIAAINKWLLDHYTDDKKFKDDMRIELSRLGKFLDDYEAIPTS